MIPYYGKRNPGGLTASSPGDTIVFPFATYNDSGASIGIGGTLAVTDIEVIKNGQPTVRATDSGYSLISDTGQVANRLGLFRVSIQLFNTADDASFYAVGSSYQVFIDSITVDARTVRAWLGTFEIGEQRANVVQLGGDTGAANWLKQTFASGFADTGVNERLARIQSDVDTGLRVHIDDLDTGLHAHISDVDTGVHAVLSVIGFDVDTGLRAQVSDVDTGIHAVLSIIAFDTDTGLRAQLSDVDTGLHDTIADLDTGLRDFIDDTDTGLTASIAAITATIDTGVVNQAVWQANASRSVTDVTGFSDTGVNERLARIASDVDTGLRAQLSDVDTGLHDTLADYDTGIRAILTLTGVAVTDTGVNERLARIQSDVDTGLRAQLSDVDTGIHDAIADLDSGLRDFIDDTDTGLTASISAITATVDTGVINQAVWQGNAVRSVTDVTGFSDTGVNERLARIQSDVDTGLRVHVDDLDSGLHAHISDVDTGLHAVLAGLSVAIDTGVVNQAVWQGNAARSVTDVTGFSDTGVNDRLGRILADTDTGLKDEIATLDTGLRDFIDNVDTGIHAVLSVIAFDADTGLRAQIADVDTGLHAHISDVDTGLHDTLSDYDTGMRALVGAVPSAFANAQALLNMDMSDVADSGTSTRRTPLQALQALRNRVEMDTGAITVFKQDDTTPSWSGTLETDTGADPIKTINPAG